MEKQNSLKILLFGDAPMALNEGGICQTLYNLFSFIEPQNFLGITAVDESDMAKIDDTYLPRYIRYKWRWIKVPFNNRFTKYLSPFFDWLNYSVCQLSSYTKLKKEIYAFNPDVIISCSNLPIGILMHNKILNDKKITNKVIPYFMDDWMYNNTTTWFGGAVHKSVTNMLQTNQYWMMIGKELGEILKERYHAAPADILYVRNPVEISNAPISDLYSKNEVFTIAYAGALWPMHYDSFYAVAKAVNILSATQKIRLLLYSSEMFWDWRKIELEPLGVVYGGHKQYNQIHSSLNKADALLITSSFQDEFYTHSKASLQTKITDYCISKRLIISCGPVYSANHNFIKENDCGICIETLDETEIAKTISQIAGNIFNYQKLVQNGWDALSDFYKPVVHEKIKSFLNDVFESDQRLLPVN